MWALRSTRSALANTGQFEPQYSYDLVRRSASVCLATRGANVDYVDSRVIGPRPVDLHIKALKAQLSGRDFQWLHPCGCADDGGLAAAVLSLVPPTDGCSLGPGTTQLCAACEPEIVDLCHFLVKMGAKIEGMVA